MPPIIKTFPSLTASSIRRLFWHRYGNRTLEWIRGLIKGDQLPFFAFIGTSGPHLGVVPAPWHRRATSELTVQAPRTPSFGVLAKDHHPLLATAPAFSSEALTYLDLHVSLHLPRLRACCHLSGLWRCCWILKGCMARPLARAFCRLCPVSVVSCAGVLGMYFVCKGWPPPQFDLPCKQRSYLSWMADGSVALAGRRCVTDGAPSSPSMTWWPES